jgi:hypothetical protein
MGRIPLRWADHIHTLHADSPFSVRPLYSLVRGAIMIRDLYSLIRLGGVLLIILGAFDLIRGLFLVVGILIQTHVPGVSMLSTFNPYFYLDFLSGGLYLFTGRYAIRRAQRIVTWAYRGWES